ncbi:MAG TPA: glycosyltransferase family 4 protein [Candidatus Saccharimonadia bacterium]|nr:glycosyltransferase family 4 protein [Candidatus Saccharimonadia bacterium]
MKILIATPYFYPRIGGMENYSLAIAHGLSQLGWEVVVVTGDREVKNIARETRDGYTIYRLPIWKVVSNTPVHPGWFFMLRKIIRAERPDCINAHTPVPFMVDMVTMAAGRVPVFVTYHAATLEKPGSSIMHAITRIYEVAQQVTLSRARAIIAVSQYVKSSLPTALHAKTFVIPNAVSGVKGPHLGGEGLLFGPNNLEPSHAWKGLDAVIDALVCYRSKYGAAPRLTVIGDGADRPRYERRVAELSLDDSVTFAGALVGEERDHLVGKSLIQVVYPTTANDAFPTILIEGWAQGLPVLAASIGPIPSLIGDGQTGLLVTPGNPAALAEAMHKLLSDPQTARTMGENARQLVEREYTWPLQVKRTAEKFEELI